VLELLFESKFPEMKEYVPSNTYEYLTGNIEMLRNRAKHTNRRHG
jgi:citrate lyase synthetase